MLLQGLFVPLTCPFYRDGASYLRKLEHNVARYSLSPAAGLLALPPGGEAGALSDAEAYETLRSTAEAAGKTKVLLAGVERASTHAALALIESADAAGFDAVVLAPPSDWARLVHGNDARELLVFFETVADRSPLPVVLWNDSRPPALQLPVAAIAGLARHPNILGLMDASLSLDRLAELKSATAFVQREVTVTPIFEAATRRMLKPEPVAGVGGGAALVTLEALSSGAAVATLPAAAVAAPVLKTRSRSVGFQILSAGPAHGMVPLLSAGVSGAVPPLAACAPQACFEAYAAWKDEDLALAEERAARLGRADELVARWGPAAVKVGCDLNGYFGGLPRLPRLPLRAEDAAAVEQSLALTSN